MTYFKQCVLSNASKGLTETAWLPEEYAILDRAVRMDDVSGWKIDHVGARQSEEWLIERGLWHRGL